PYRSRLRGPGGAGEAVERLGGGRLCHHAGEPGQRDGCRELWGTVRNRPPPRRQDPHRPGVPDCRPGLPGRLPAQCPATHEMLRGRADPGRPHDSDLRVQLRRIPRGGPGPDVRRLGRPDGAERHLAAGSAHRLPVRLEDRRGASRRLTRMTPVRYLSSWEPVTGRENVREIRTAPEVVTAARELVSEYATVHGDLLPGIELRVTPDASAHLAIGLSAELWALIDTDPELSQR